MNAIDGLSLHECGGLFLCHDGNHYSVKSHIMSCYKKLVMLLRETRVCPSYQICVYVVL